VLQVQAENLLHPLGLYRVDHQLLAFSVQVCVICSWDPQGPDSPSAAYGAMPDTPDMMNLINAIDGRFSGMLRALQRKPGRAERGTWNLCKAGDRLHFTPRAKFRDPRFSPLASTQPGRRPAIYKSVTCTLMFDILSPNQRGTFNCASHRQCR
jgi:hypothetical protein